MKTGHDGLFATTRWTIVMNAGGADDPLATAALEELCGAYWFPLYAYVRRRGHGKEDAEDIVQRFFEKLLNRRDLEGLDAGKGRFRAFLLASMKHHLSNEYDRAHAVKRGGMVSHLPLDWETADTRYQLADQDSFSPDAAFDREWALALLERVIVKMRGEWQGMGRVERFDLLKSYLTAGKGEYPDREVAARLGMEEGTLRVTIHRLRKRYRVLLKEEVAGTLSDPAMVEQELTVLLGAFTPD